MQTSHKQLHLQCPNSLREFKLTATNKIFDKVIYHFTTLIANMILNHSYIWSTQNSLFIYRVSVSDFLWVLLCCLDNVWHASFSGAFHHKDLASQHQFGDRSDLSGHFKRSVVSEMPLNAVTSSTLSSQCVVRLNCELKHFNMCRLGQLLWPCERCCCHYRLFLRQQNQMIHRTQ